MFQTCGYLGKKLLFGALFCNLSVEPFLELSAWQRGRKQFYGQEDGMDIGLLELQMDSMIHIKPYFIAKLLETEIFITESPQIPP